MVRLLQYAEGKAESAPPRILPFAIFMAFIASTPLLQWGLSQLSGSVSTSDLMLLWLYPLRAVAVLLLLVHFWPLYTELHEQVWENWQELALTIMVGTFVYILWVRMNWAWATQGQAAGYNPFQSDIGIGIILAGMRVFGATIVVPLMEELFWRSFLLRFLVKSPYASVPLGTFSVFSCVATVVLFGLEHHHWLAGIMAGLVYNLLLYKTRRLWPCVVAHASTNFALSIHVLVTGEWQWW